MAARGATCQSHPVQHGMQAHKVAQRSPEQALLPLQIVTGEPWVGNRTCDGSSGAQGMPSGSRQGLPVFRQDSLIPPPVVLYRCSPPCRHAIREKRVQTCMVEGQCAQAVRRPSGMLDPGTETHPVAQVVICFAAGNAAVALALAVELVCACHLVLVLVPEQEPDGGRILGHPLSQPPSLHKRQSRSGKKREAAARTHVQGKSSDSYSAVTSALGTLHSSE